MLDVLSIVFPIYALIAVGFTLTRRGVFSGGDLQAMGRYIMNLALPALVFTALADRPLAQTLQLPYVLIYGLGTLLLIGVLYPTFRYVGKHDRVTAALATMGSTCPNSGFVGYPILLLAMPEVAPQILAQNVLMENVLFIPLLLTMMEAGSDGTETRGQIARRVARRVLTAPLVMGMAAGVAVSLSGFGLPDALNRPVHMLAASSGAISLVVIGGTLASLRPTGVRQLAGYIVFGKLVLHPLFMLAGIVVVAGAGVLPVPDDMRAALIISGAVPALGIFPVLAQSYGRAGFASVALFGGTVVSVFTLTALLLVLF